MRDSQGVEYDMQKRARAITGATLRAAVAAYIIYLGWNIIKGVREGSTTMPPWLGWTAGIVFIAAALGVCVYIWKRYRQDLEAARLPADGGEEEPAAEPAEAAEDENDGAE